MNFPKGHSSKIQRKTYTKVVTNHDHLNPIAVLCAVLVASSTQADSTNQRAKRTHKQEEWAGIATIDVIGISEYHVSNLLKKYGIRSGFEGSVVYEVRVPKKYSSRALKLILKDAKVHPYMYFQVEGFKGKLGLPAVEKLPARKFDIDLSKINSYRSLKVDRNLSGLAQGALESLRSTQQENRFQKPFVSQMRLFAMEYMNTKGKLSKGYYAEVSVSNRGQLGSVKFFQFSWEMGQCIWPSTPGKPSLGFDPDK